MTRVALILLLVAGCGYTTSARRADGTVHTLYVAPISEPGIDLDAGADVARAVRLAIGRASGLALEDAATADYTVTVEIVAVDTSLAPFSEPSLRAAQYAVRISVRAVLEAVPGEIAWTTPVVVGTSQYLSTPGGVAALDGANRRTIEVAAEQAASRLVTMIQMRLAERGATVATSTVP